jgi:hypothetical protein
MSDRATRVGINESLSREVNEALSVDEDGEELAIICECGRNDCAERIFVTSAEYAEARADSVLFLVLRGHSDPIVEEVVGGRGDHQLVRKHGRAAEVAEELDSS